MNAARPRPVPMPRDAVVDDDELDVVEQALVRAVSAAIVKRLIQEETEDRQDPVVGVREVDDLKRRRP